jgi:hypothetical protein
LAKHILSELACSDTALPSSAFEVGLLAFIAGKEFKMK